jgi:hypothetical protein
LIINPAISGKPFKTYLVNLINTKANTINGTWRVNCTTILPPVSKVLHATVAVGQGAHKKILYYNGWNKSRTFDMFSTRQDMVSLYQSRFTVPVSTRCYLRSYQIDHNADAGHVKHEH